MRPRGHALTTFISPITTGGSPPAPEFERETRVASPRDAASDARPKCCKIPVYTRWSRHSRANVRLDVVAFGMPLIEKKKQKERSDFYPPAEMLTEVMRVFPQPIVRNISLLNSRGLNAKNRKLRLIHQVGSFSLAKYFVYYSLCKRATLWHFVHRIFLSSAAEKSKTNATERIGGRVNVFSHRRIRIYYHFTLFRRALLLDTWNLSIPLSSMSPPSFSLFYINLSIFCIA